ncbi:nitroreductase family protein [Chloroflexota bacterium]
MELKDLTDLIKTRRSIRHWQNKEVSPDILKQAIETAIWAPNAGNMQNWHFYVVTNRETINAMGDAFEANADIVASWIEAENLGEAAIKWRKSASVLRTAPAIIAAAAEKYERPPDKVIITKAQTDPKAKQIHEWRSISSSRLQTVAAATSYLILVLHQMGLGTLWMTGPMQAKGEIEKILNVPSEEDIFTLISVGYPDESPVPKERRPIDEVCTIIK